MPYAGIFFLYFVLFLGPGPLFVFLLWLFFRGGQCLNEQTLAPNYGHFSQLCHGFGGQAPVFAYFCPLCVLTIAKHAAGLRQISTAEVNRFWCVYLFSTARDSQRRLGILPEL